MRSVLLTNSTRRSSSTKSLDICREFGDRANYKEGRAISNLGAAFYSLDQHNKAIEFCTKSLNISRELWNRAGEGSALGNLGNAFCSLDQHNKAIKFYTKSLNIFRELGDRAGECRALGNLEWAMRSVPLVNTTR